MSRTIEVAPNERRLPNDDQGEHDMKTSKISVILWIIQILLALLFLFAGGTKLVMPAAELTKQGPFNAPFLRFIGVMEVLGAIGLIVPAATRIKPVLTPIAAAGLVIIMIGATIVSVKMMGPSGAIIPLVTGVCAAFVAYGRWHLAPIAERGVRA